jgi:radical SAM protein with 4Fe4S-binding SPASM domain
MSRLTRLLPTSLKDSLKASVDKNPLLRYVYAKTIVRGYQTRGYPTSVTIELTDRCNLRCSYCPKSKGVGVSGGDMDFELFKEIVDKANEFHSVEQMILVGYGEPLLYPRLVDAIKYIKGKYPYTEVVITTNGILLNKNMGRQLIDSGLDTLTISVNSWSAEKYKKLNNADKYELVVENTRNFLQLLNRYGEKRKPSTYIQILQTVNTEKEISDFVAYWSFYVSPNARITFNPMCNWGGQLDIEGYTPKKMKRYPCEQLQRSIIVTREGKVIPCCAILPESAGDLVLGNIQDKSFKELYTEGKIEYLRSLDLDGRVNELEPCKNCDSWQISPNAWFKNPLHRLGKRLWV